MRILIVFICVCANSICVANDEGTKILQQIAGLTPPSPVLATSDKAAYMAHLAGYNKQRYALILELFERDPSNPQLPKLMRERWMRFEKDNQGQPAIYRKNVTSDIDRVLAQNPPFDIRQVGETCKAYTEILYPDGKTNPLKVAERFVTMFPKSNDAPSILQNAAHDLPEAEKLKVYRRIADAYQKYSELWEINGALKRQSAIGKQFHIAFQDAISGKPIDTLEMKGKVVLVEFWATWCLDCIDELPKIRELYAKDHPRGLEIVCVSMDSPEMQGGLKSLRQYVADHQMPWPQYYQGGDWNGPFTSSWGINDIPIQFIVDREGNLAKVGKVDDKAFVSLIESLLKPL